MGRIIDITRSLKESQTTFSPALKESLLAFFGGKVFYTLIGLFIWYSKFRPPYAYFFYYDVTPVLEGLAGAFLGVWQRWDSIHYQRIAQYGYINDHVSLFYPFYPLLSRWMAAITHIDILSALLLVSNLAFFASMVLLHKIVSQQFSPQAARMTLLSIVLFPSSFYFYAIFPQSLLLFLSLLTYYFIRRGWWAGAVVAGYLAGLTHSTAVGLSILVGIEALQYLWPKLKALREGHGRLEWKVVFPLVAPFSSLLGIGSFFAWRQMAGFPSYVSLQGLSYARELTLPWDGIAAIIRVFFYPDKAISILVNWMNNACFLLLVFLIIWSFRRIPWSWWLMQAGFLIFISTNLTVGYPLIGFFRYIIGVFPLFVEIALLGQQPRWRLLKFGLGLVLSFIYSAMFFMWQYDL